MQWVMPCMDKASSTTHPRTMKVASLTGSPKNALVQIDTTTHQCKPSHLRSPNIIWLPRLKSLFWASRLSLMWKDKTKRANKSYLRRRTCFNRIRCLRRTSKSKADKVDLLARERTTQNLNPSPSQTAARLVIVLTLAHPNIVLSQGATLGRAVMPVRTCTTNLLSTHLTWLMEIRSISMLHQLSNWWYSTRRRTCSGKFLRTRKRS